MITVILAVLAGLSAVYGIIVFLYSGIQTVWLWTGLTIFLGALAWGNHYYLLHKNEPEYYRDPLSKNGYCNGRQTYKYVRQVLDTYNNYKNIKQ